MTRQFTLQGKFAIVVGALLIAVTLALLYMPTFILQWYAGSYQTERSAHYEERAQTLKNQLDKTTRPGLHFQYQDLMIKAGKRQETVEYYQTLVDQNPQNKNYPFYSARLFDKDDGGARLIENADANHEAAYAYYAEKALKDGHYLEAIHHASEMPDSWLKHFLLAEAHAALNIHEPAHQHYQQAIRAENTTLESRVDYAFYLFTHKQTTDQHPLAEWPGPDITLYPQAYVLSRIYKKPDILDVFNYAPLSIICAPASLNLMAEEALLQDDIITARILLNRSDRIQPNQAAVKALFGVLAHMEERYDYSDKLLNTGLGTDAFPDVFHIHIAKILQRWNKDFPHAYNHYLKAWGEPPHTISMLTHHAEQLLQGNKPCNAITWLELALKISNVKNEENNEIDNLLTQAQEGCDEG